MSRIARGLFKLVARVRERGRASPPCLGRDKRSVQLEWARGITEATRGKIEAAGARDRQDVQGD
jgi:hypothetical protein